MRRLMAAWNYLSEDQQNIGADGRQRVQSPGISHPGRDNKAHGSNIAL